MEYRSLPAIFVADATGLDFLNSIATPVDEPIDWIADGEGLLSWLDQARLVPGDVLARTRLQIAPAELDEVAAKARGLREWFRHFVQTRKGQRLAAEALNELDALNSVLQRDEKHGLIVADTSPAGGLAFTMQRRYSTAESLLMPIVEALARLVCEEDFTYVKACKGPKCTLLFADHTHGHARQWCSMAICGNRAKAAAHRARLKAGKNG
ncbi:ABATE domain-containing protein [Caballeronia sp. LZ032]|uniref:CGNR zinc finger domain-containing protein n=1 Tax=Caballeronia sp. LZ032 TaxID=3038565 RepID=UPI0028584ABE|nr:ABATE domain-containing protein [Caballeronia sp. LZ032]MDR5878035.1 CGNR zinc finger domain-containing protein [Caballeronia sp. LZ032]